MTRLFHVSDLHFGREDRAALDWFADRVAKEQPDAIILTGDLTMRARAREFAAAAEWLAQFSVPISVQAGNHDLPYFNPWARFVAPYRRYRALQALIEKPLDLPGVSIVPLKTTARAQMRLNWSKGNVSQRALDETLSAIAKLDGEGLVFVACHHPLIEAETVMSSQTRGGLNALKALAAAGADAVLTGHVHDPFDLPVTLGGETIRMIGAGTLSTRLRHEPPSFNEIVITDGLFTTVAHLVGEGATSL